MTTRTTPGSDPSGDLGRVSPEQLESVRAEGAATSELVNRVRTETHVHGDRMDSAFAVLLRSSAAVSLVCLVFGVLMKMFVPVSGDDKSLTLFQVLDGEKTPDLMDHSSSWGTGTGWLIPIGMVAVCAALVLAVSANARRGQGAGRLVTVTEVFCWCLAVGCVLGFAALAGMSYVVAVPAGLVIILLGALFGIVTCRLVRVYAG